MISRQPNGYIALVSMVLIGAILLLLVLALTFTGLTQKFSLIGHKKAVNSYYLSNACLHYALINLQKDPEYQGNETVKIDDFQCKIEPISGSGNTNRVIITSTDLDNYLNKIKVEIAQLKPRTIISSWTELSDF